MRKKQIGLATFLVVLHLSLFSQIPTVQVDSTEWWSEVSVRNLNSSNGLPQNSVEDFFVAPNGIMWLATHGGVVRYDGINTKTYGKEHFILNRARSFYIMNDSLVLPSYQAAFNKVINPHAIEPVSYEGDYHKRYFFSEQSVWYEIKDSLNSFNRPLVIAPDHFMIRTSGRKGFSWRKGDAIWSVPYEVPIQFENTFFSQDSLGFALDSNGIIWHLGDYTKKAVAEIPKDLWSGLWRHKEGREFVYKGHYEHPFLHINRNLYRIQLKEGKWVLSLLLSDIDIHQITSVIVDDAHGYIYAGTYSDGFHIYRRKSMQQINLARDCDEFIRMRCVYLFGDSLFNYQGDLWYNNQLKCDAMPATMDEFHIDVDQKNKRVITSNYYQYPPTWGYYKINNGLVKDYTPLDTGLVYNKSGEAVETRIGDFLLRGDSIYYYNPLRGLGVYDGYKKKIIIPAKDTLYGNHFLDYNKHHLLLSSSNGLVDFNLKKRSSRIIPGGEKIDRLLSYNEGLVWAGSYGDGAYYIPEGLDSAYRFKLWGYPELDFTHEVILKDSLYLFTTNKGLFAIHNKDIQRWLAGDTLIQVHLLGPMDGLEDPEFNGGGHPCHQVYRDGRIAFSAIQGFNIWNPNIFNFPRKGSKVYLEEFKVKEGSAKERAGVLEIDPDYSSLSIRLLFPYLGENPRNAQIFYRIPEQGDNWQEYNRSAGISLSPMRFGTYHLEVRVPVLSDKIIVLKKFKVLAPFYWTVWFWGLNFILFLILIFFFIRARDRRAKAKQLELEQIVAERTEEIAKTNVKLQTALDTRNKMISILSHDIKGPARFLGDLVMMIKGKLDKDQQERVAQEFEYLESTTVSFNERINSVLDWIRGEFQQKDQGGNWSLILPIWRKCIQEHQVFAKKNNLGLQVLYPEIDLDKLEVKCEEGALDVILNNLISNALKHARNTIRLELRPQNGELHLFIEDDGGGLSSEEELYRINKGVSIGSKPGKRGAKGSGLGLLIVHELVQRNQGRVYFRNGQMGLEVELWFESR